MAVWTRAEVLAKMAEYQIPDYSELYKAWMHEIGKEKGGEHYLQHL